MKRLMGLAIAAIPFLMLSSARVTAAELFSVRCEGGAPVRPYFATFDVDAKAVVFETPPIDVETNFGINVHSGEIISTSDGKIEFMLPVRPGRIDLILDRNKKTMTWPGLDDPTFRPTLTHQCTVTPPRSILSFRVRDPIQHPVSVRCEDAGYLYFTMDAASKQAIFERGKEGQLYRGEVTDVSSDEIALVMNFDVPRRVVWNKSRQTITFEGIEGDVSRPRGVMQCEEVAPRTMIVYHARLWRR
ncbi:MULTISPECIES: hypothetical protein [Bradyrhizobium]|uniref:C-type lysozyme inhibitor domain-containing protein n=1 Tax=Bradyrhizobium frederickii TaxID=2560054 RepID=A0A4Y9KVU5_9BRAD|nr:MULTISPECIES: hypothetical protein [Bradyrhizobium]RTE91116.1 hypothetical protein D6B98_20785 [Bradyrhizobium sp. LVM 105]TFV35478.1 hypothetical protein E4K66_26595 [Bradyrhizobium frederickii]